MTSFRTWLRFRTGCAIPTLRPNISAWPVGELRKSCTHGARCLSSGRTAIARDTFAPASSVGAKALRPMLPTTFRRSSPPKASPLELVVQAQRDFVALCQVHVPVTNLVALDEAHTILDMRARFEDAVSYSPTCFNKVLDGGSYPVGLDCGLVLHTHAASTSLSSSSKAFKPPPKSWWALPRPPRWLKGA